MIVAYIKPSNFCPLDCSHCYLSKETRHKKEIMSDKVFLDSIKNVRSIAELQNKQVIIMWHGGEPLNLPGLSKNQMVYFYYQRSQAIKKILGKLLHSETMQTSLIHYQPNSGITKMLINQFGGVVGTSFDNFRTLKGSRELYQQKWLQKVNEARVDGIKVGITMVPDLSMHDYIVTDNITAYLKNNGFNDVHIDRELGERALNNKQHSQILKNLFIAGNKYKVDFSAVSAAKNLLKNQVQNIYTPQDRWGASCTSSFITVEPDGRLHACPDISEGVAWNLQQEPKERLKWIRKGALKSNNTTCINCEYLPSCKGGCPITAFNDGSGECSGYKTFLDYLQTQLDLNLLPNPNLEVVNV